MIRTDRLVLRRWRSTDAPLHNALCREPDVARFLGEPPTMADSHDVVIRQNDILDRYGSCFFAIERLGDEAFIGWCGVKPGPDDTPIAGLPELGWSLRRDCWGQGLAGEAARAALDFFWRASAAIHVLAITTPANTRSRAVMERLGMMHQTGADFDHPGLAPGDPLRRHVLYRIARPADPLLARSAPT